MLCRRRQAGMGANPLSYLELEAFERKAGLDLSLWEVDLIMRLDDAVLEAVRGDAPTGPAKKANGEPADPVEASAADPQGVKALFRGIAARKAATPSKT